jgi:CubicO group peptidase (beta-lactamase class C family)/D-alanyl-D-alanine dipeptidase
MLMGQRGNPVLARILVTSAWLTLGMSISCCRAPVIESGSDIPPSKRSAEVVEVLRPFIQREMSEKEIPALSIAIVEDQQIVWAQGFGMEDPNTKKAATAKTVYRIGSVSKLFTDIAVMQLVERGELKLDAPITDYLPDFHPQNPFATPITLRQLMSHRSGLLREPPVGNYFDPSAASLAATVHSLNDTELVLQPNTQTKYSNAAIAVVGYLLESRSRQPFAKYLKSFVLDPLGLRQSSFEPEPQIVQSLARAQMWTYDGLKFDAPTFQRGISPAGSMYSTAIDLGHFVSVLLAKGKAKGTVLLRPATLEEMWSPQSPNPGSRFYGLGFNVRSFDGHRLIGHGGAIYGFATTLDFLPEEKIGVVVIATKDVSNAVTDRIGEEALRLVLAHRGGKPMTAPPVTSPIPPELGRRLVGRYGTGDDAFDLDFLNGHLTMMKVAGGAQLELRKLGEDLIVDGTMSYGARVTPVEGGLRVDSKLLPKVPQMKPVDVPASWKGLIGEYGWDHDILYVFEKEGRLNVLIEWIEYDALTQISDDAFKFPMRGIYSGEKAVFTRDAGDNGTQVQVSGVVFKRRPRIGLSRGVYRISPSKNLGELRRQTLAEQPPREAGEFRTPDLVEIATLDPTIKLDIRYATTNNFLGAPLYSQARAFLQRPAAEALLRANKRLREIGYGMLILDAYRPWYVTKIFWEATPENKRLFVADPRKGSRHNRGCAVDLSVYELATGKPVEMVGVYDEMSERSYAGYPGGTSLQRWLRDLLRRTMEDEGFLVYPFEWWHFDYSGWREYPILNFTFDRLSSNVGLRSVRPAKATDSSSKRNGWKRRKSIPTRVNFLGTIYEP